MKIVSSIVVRRALPEVWSFLCDPRNSPKWDRSVGSANLLSEKMAVGARVETRSPAGKRQTFRVDELASPRLRFSLERSPMFRSAQLVFNLEEVDGGTRIEHVIEMQFRLYALPLMAVVKLTQRKALGTDLEYLRRALDEDFDVRQRG
ncbi:MAG: SRPBCC family protein [Myxococcaceae bacterium]